MNKNTDTRFIDFQQVITDMNDPVGRQFAVDRFMEIIVAGDYPIIENDTTVVLLYQGDDEGIAITGDMNEWVKSIPYKKIPGTNLFYLRFTVERDTRMEYWLLPQSGEMFATDKLNPYQVWNGFGPVSELAMPGYRRHPYFDDFKYGKKWDPTTLENFVMPAGVLEYPHQVHVYFPPGYESSQEVYPTIYVQDGLDYVEFAIVPGVLNQLIENGEIEPLIAIFVTPPNRHLPEMPNRMTEYGMNDDYVSFMCEELVPEISQRYRTENQASARLIVGDSFGGLISVYAGFKRPDIFGLVYGQSGYYSFQEDTLIKQITISDTQPVRFYIDVGLYEHYIGGDLLPASEVDFLAANRRLKSVLEERGYDLIYREYPEGHTWGNWRRHLIDALIHFFGTGE
ncbi:MAG: hypothetical protein H8E14_00065 [Candidatus Marinimicrobia bacterium]|nr:hypothetical protein [Candidatus Neomarinimicrobiota bacterium]